LEQNESLILTGDDSLKNFFTEYTERGKLLLSGQKSWRSFKSFSIHEKDKLHERFNSIIAQNAPSS